MALPSNVSFGTVIGTFLLATADSPDDADRDPQGIPATDLKIRFTPDLSPAAARDATANPPSFFALQDVNATVGTDGSLLGPDGAPGVRLVASTNPALNPTGWTWQVVLSGTGFPTIKFSFQLDADATVDLATVLQVPPNPGATLNAWLNAVAAAQAAQAAAEAAAASVPSAASIAATYVALRGTWQPNTAYPALSLVIYSGTAYLALADVPGRTTFTASDWFSLGGAVADLIVSLVAGGFSSISGSGVSDAGTGIATLTSTLVSDSGTGIAVLAA